MLTRFLCAVFSLAILFPERVVAETQPTREVVFIAFEITSPEKLADFNEKFKKYEGLWDKEEFVSITNSFDQTAMKRIDLDTNHVVIEELYYAQYAKDCGGRYKLYKSDKLVGFSCDLLFEEPEKGGFIIKGSARFHEVSRREPFTPLPDADIGIPIWRMGGRIEKITMLASKKVACLVDLQSDVSDGDIYKRQGLILLIDRDVSVEKKWEQGSD